MNFKSTYVGAYLADEYNYYWVFVWGFYCN